MNVFLVYDNGTVVTPEINGSILEGVTRSSLLALAVELGYKTDERKVTVREWREGVSDGGITEGFACGTAAVITPIETLRWRGGEATTGPEAGPLTLQRRERLLDVQYGRVPDTHGW